MISRCLQIFAFFLLLTANVEAEQLTYKSCLANQCIYDSPSSEARVIHQLGPGVKTRRLDDAGNSRCYFDPITNTWAEFTFAAHAEGQTKGTLIGITLTEVDICKRDTSKSKVSLGRMLAGISLGWSENDVLRKLGTPSRIDDALERERNDPSIRGSHHSAVFGERVFVYDDETSIKFTFVYLTDGKVRSIWTAAVE